MKLKILIPQNLIQAFQKLLQIRFIKTTLRLLPLIALIAIPIAVEAQGVIATKLDLYNSVWWSTFWTWIVITVIGSVVCGLLLSMLDPTIGIGCGVVALIFVGLIGAYVNSNSRANHARTDNWDAMVTEKATYVEKLLGVWVGVGEETFSCHYNDTDYDVGGLAATGCENVVKDSYCDSYDDKGNCDDTDYQWFPMFTQEVTQWGELNVYQNGHVVFCYHCAPLNWQSYISNDTGNFLDIGHYWNGTNLENGTNSVPGIDFTWNDHVEFHRVQDAYNRGELLPGVVYHNTLNWINADKETVFRGSTQLVPEYAAKGLMPSILPLTNSHGEVFTQDIFGNRSGPYGYDFQIVQFLGTLNPPIELQNELQHQALLWASYAGPNLKANLMLNLAYASEVPNPDQWINTTKAHMMDNDTWGRTTLAMNMAIWNCGVSADMTTIDWCRLETGAFEDNVQLKVLVSNHAPFAFTPESLFGQLQGGFVLDGPNKVTTDVDWDDRPNTPIAQSNISFASGVINDAMFGTSSGYKYVKVSKEVYSDKQYLISPDPDQINRIKSSHSSGTFTMIGGFWFIAVFAILAALSKRR